MAFSTRTTGYPVTAEDWNELVNAINNANTSRSVDLTLKYKKAIYRVNFVMLSKAKHLFFNEETLRFAQGTTLLETTSSLLN